MTASVVLSAFLRNCLEEKRAALIQYLPPSEQEILTSFKDPTKEFPSWQEMLERIHYSWFAPFLRSLSENEIKLFLPIFSEPQVKGLKKMLLFANHLTPIPAIAKEYLGKILLSHVMKQEILPIPCLPESPLNVLTELSFPELFHLIHKLGVHDLAFDMRKIIDTAKVRNIYNALPTESQVLLKSLQYKKEAIAFKEMGLEKWTGDAEELKKWIFQRGVNRLAKALFGEHDSLIWHITHALDTETAQLFMQLCTDLANPKALQVLREQIKELIK